LRFGCPLIVGISGQVGSGKSTLAKTLADILGGENASFGDYVRHLATQSGVSTERSSLQQIGQASVRSGPADFVHSFLGWANPKLDRPFVVDGVRHIDVDGVLRNWAQSNGIDYLAVHVSTTDDLRAHRRTDGSVEALAQLDAHPVEHESISDLPATADLHFDNDWHSDQLATAISNWYQSKAPSNSGGAAIS
jgi:energy-coupling factor transporter ATP-binding protein EcfA2